MPAFQETGGIDSFCLLFADDFDPIISLSATFPHTAKKFARGGLCPRAAKTEYSSWERQQGFKIQSVPAPRTPFHGEGFLAAFQ